MEYWYLGKRVRKGMVVRFEDKAGKIRCGVVLLVVPEGERPAGPSVILTDFTTVSSWPQDPKLLFTVDDPDEAVRYTLDPAKTSYIFAQDEQLGVYAMDTLHEDHGFGVGWVPAETVKMLSKWVVDRFSSFELTDPNALAILHQMTK